MDDQNKNLRNYREESGQPRFPSGVVILHLLLSFHEIRASLDRIFREFADAEGRFGLDSMVRAARFYGVKAKAIKAKIRNITKLPLPFIAEMKDGSFVIIAKLVDDRILVQGAQGQGRDLSLAEFEAEWNGHVVLVMRKAHDVMSDVKFGLRWFVPAMAKYKGLFAEVLTASFMLQVFALVTPLIFMVIIDKVLVHRGLLTLDVLIFGLVTIIIFEAILGLARTYIFTHTTSRIDVHLGSQLYGHMLNLPLSYFEKRPTGQTVARVRELDSVREFLTSSALTVAIDAVFTVIFFAVLWWLSPTLTIIVLASIPFYVAISIIITPPLRRRAEERFQRSAINQSFMVESVAGIQTLKAMAVEPHMRARWDENLAAYVRTSLRATLLGATGSQVVSLVNRITMALILWFGALKVMGGELTVGQLVAFNMIANQVSQPILRLAQLWQNFQQFRISIQRLGDILNTKTERQSRSSPENLSTIKGHVKFENVSFSYDQDSPTVLKDVSFEILAGQTVGIVGRSGSGKSTLAGMLQRFYVPDTGQILIDGNNVALLDITWLRTQLGVVSQENDLFKRKIGENIALGNSTMPQDQIYAVAELADAHEFISEQPHGYDTELEERGQNLSGGQRQRIAIARALATNPRILILDEATAALDYESERIFQDNLRRVTENLTVIIIAHRLSTVRDCDQILVMDKGRLADQGTHEELVGREGIYANLVRQERR